MRIRVVDYFAIGLGFILCEYIGIIALLAWGVILAVIRIIRNTDFSLKKKNIGLVKYDAFMEFVGVAIIIGASYFLSFAIE